MMKGFTKFPRMDGAVYGVLFLLVVGNGLLGVNTLQAQVSDQLVISPKDKSFEKYKYMGSISCDGSGCHGSTKKKQKFSIPQNEYYVWYEKDRHAKAFEVLKTEDSKRMAKNLGIKTPEADTRCLVCHAVDVDKDNQGANYALNEGVTCEGCHGPAEAWLGPHTRKDWDKKKGAEFGMLDTKNLAKRSERCLSCHLGVNKSRIVDHELIGAGHPRLKFEMDNYSAVMPSHWDQTDAKKKEAIGELRGVKIWSVGQAVALQQQLNLLSESRKAPTVLGPDLIHFDCFACHHEVVPKLRDLSEAEKKIQRWRVRDYGGKPGRLVWNSSNYSVFRNLIKEIAPDKAITLEKLIVNFQDGLTGKSSVADFDQVLKNLEEFATQLVPVVQQQEFTGKTVWSVMRRISGDAGNIANAGFQSSEQAVLALASLYEAYSGAVGHPSNKKDLMAVLDSLYEDIKDGRQFDVVKFSQHLTAFRGLLEPDVPSSPSAGK
jgi:hypothetical protein